MTRPEECFGCCEPLSELADDEIVKSEFFPGQTFCSRDCESESLDARNADREHDLEFGDDDRSEFADPGGNSALRAATKDNPRNLPCPTCNAQDVLTPKDRALGYQCNRCADRAEGNYVGGDY